MQISCEIISINEETQTAILNFRMTNERGEDEPKMVMVDGKKMRDL